MSAHGLPTVQTRSASVGAEGVTAEIRSRTRCGVVRPCRRTHGDDPTSLAEWVATSVDSSPSSVQVDEAEVKGDTKAPEDCGQLMIETIGGGHAGCWVDDQRATRRRATAGVAKSSTLSVKTNLEWWYCS